MMNHNESVNIKTLMYKAYEVYNGIDRFLSYRGESEETEELKSARNTACDVVDALQYILETFGDNDNRY